MNDSRNTGQRRASIAVAVASLLVGASVMLVVTQLPEDPPGTTTDEFAFSGGEAAKVGYEWWNAVHTENLQGLMSLTHRDSSISTFPDIPLSRDRDITIAVDSVPFGSLSEPQLCYLLTGSGSQATGSMVFRADGINWLVWEIRPDVDSCYVPVPPDL